MLSLHVLSGELMLITIVLLFCRTKLDAIKCTGCAACELCCPTATIESNDEKGLRVFTYSHYECIACGACIQTCPEGAASLSHEMSLRRMFQVTPKEEIRSVELNVCERCGCFFAPTPQLERVKLMVAEGEREIPVLKYCVKCRRRFVLDQINPKNKPDTTPVSQGGIRMQQ
jgi:ferredoxin